MNIKTYTEARAKGLRAIDAYRWATAPAPPELDWQNDEQATTERAGFDVRVRVEPDDYTDLSWLGEFTDDPDGAVANPDYQHGRYRYFKPTYTVAEHRRDLQAIGWAKGPAEHEAREQANRDARMAVDYQEYIIGVTVLREGIELGSAYLGGVGFGDDYSENRRYVEETADDLIGEAIEEARETVQKLCKRG